MSNNQVLIGEIKGMELGVLSIETDYSDSDFKVEWSNVKGLNTSADFIIMLSSRYRIKGTINMDEYNPQYLIISPVEGSRLFAKIEDIVYLKLTEDGFWDKVKASIDGGYSITKASSTKQLTINGDFSYTNTALNAQGYIKLLDNRVEEDTTIIKTVRNNTGSNIRVFLNKSWFISSAADLLQSDEQNLALRSTNQVGIGKILVRNHLVFLYSSVGVASNTEKFKDGDDYSQSLEGFAELELNAYGYDDFTFYTKLQLYPSLSKENRFRTVYNFNVKYDLPLDFYVGASATLNYDNKPGEDVSKFDYVFQSVFGWSF
ncbi:DUF481 domain-containing protein [Reichenbachiella agariperforans]|nr:DUF481 domain-containing protein [Reichenbachiella agariperforans]